MRLPKFIAHAFWMACFALPGAYPQQIRKPPLQIPSARLTSAKNVLVSRARGSSIPYDVIKTTIDGWERFTIVEKPNQADLVVQVSTSGGDHSVSFSSANNPSPETGNFDQPTRASRDVSPSDITMTVYDARSKRVLWIARETANYAVKEKARENNLVEAAERLAAKFHDRIEPPLKDKD